MPHRYYPPYENNYLYPHDSWREQNHSFNNYTYRMFMSKNSSITTREQDIFTENNIRKVKLKKSTTTPLKFFLSLHTSLNFYLDNQRTTRTNIFTLKYIDSIYLQGIFDEHGNLIQPHMQHRLFADNGSRIPRITRHHFDHDINLNKIIEILPNLPDNLSYYHKYLINIIILRLKTRNVQIENVEDDAQLLDPNLVLSIEHIYHILRRWPPGSTPPYQLDPNIIMKCDNDTVYYILQTLLFEYGVHPNENNRVRNFIHYNLNLTYSRKRLESRNILRTQLVCEVPFTGTTLKTYISVEPNHVHYKTYREMNHDVMNGLLPPNFDTYTDGFWLYDHCGNHHQLDNLFVNNKVSEDLDFLIEKIQSSHNIPLCVPQSGGGKYDKKHRNFKTKGGHTSSPSWVSTSSPSPDLSLHQMLKNFQIINLEESNLEESNQEESNQEESNQETNIETNIEDLENEQKLNDEANKFWLFYKKITIRKIEHELSELPDELSELTELKTKLEADLPSSTDFIRTHQLKIIKRRIEWIDKSIKQKPTEDFNESQIQQEREKLEAQQKWLSSQGGGSSHTSSSSSSSLSDYDSLLKKIKYVDRAILKKSSGSGDGGVITSTYNKYVKSKIIAKIPKKYTTAKKTTSTKTTITAAAVGAASQKTNNNKITSFKLGKDLPAIRIKKIMPDTQKMLEKLVLAKLNHYYTATATAITATTKNKQKSRKHPEKKERK